MKWKISKIFSVALILVWLTGCELRQAMYNHGRIKPYEESDFFPDGRSARTLVEGTIARGQLKADSHLYYGQVDGTAVSTFPYPIDAEFLKRGQERYEIFCSVCHGYVGTGNGMIVQRGFKVPPDLHEDRMHRAPVGYLFRVISEGFGEMPAYSAQIPERDRWAIIAYMRALQLSQKASINDVPASQRNQLEEEGQ